MARVWPRLAAAVLTAGLTAVATGCRRPPKQEPGQLCSAQGKLSCVDFKSALLCQHGKLVTLPCRGPRGCRGRGLASTCDDDFALEGDPCQQAVNDVGACTPDHERELVCRDGGFVLRRACPGPKGCAAAGDVITCDDGSGDGGLRP